VSREPIEQLAATVERLMGEPKCECVKQKGRYE